MTHKYPSPDTGKKVIPSVTTMIGDATDKSGPLTQWAANQVVEWIRQNCWMVKDFPGAPQKYLLKDGDLEAARFHFRDVSQEALDVGSEVHAAIEHYLTVMMDGTESLQYCKNDLLTVLSAKNEQAAQSFGAFLQWADEHDLTPIATEQTVYGMTDDTWHWAGTADLSCYLDGEKTLIDLKTSKNHYPSEHGPQIAAYRSCIEGTTRSGILRLDKSSGEPSYKDYSKRHDKDLEIFHHMVRLYMARHPRIAKKAEAA